MNRNAIGWLGSVIVAGVSVGLVACGDSANRLPNSPSSSAVSSTAAAGDSHHGGGDSGNSGPGSANSGSGGSNSGPGGPHTTPTPTTPTTPTTPSANEVEFTAIATAVTGSCPALTLTFAGHKVTTTASTLFRHVACQDVKAGQNLEVKGSTKADGSVDASRVQVEDDENEIENEHEATGPILTKTGACPALTLTVGTTKITTTAATVFDDGACSTLAVGTAIEAKGTTQPDGSLLALRVERVIVEP